MFVSSSVSHSGALPSGKRHSQTIHVCMTDASLQLQLSLGECRLIRGDSMDVIYIYDLYIFFSCICFLFFLGVNHVIQVKA